MKVLFYVRGNDVVPQVFLLAGMYVVYCTALLLLYTLVHVFRRSKEAGCYHISSSTLSEG